MLGKRPIFIVAVAVTLALTSPEAFATLIYDNGGPNQGGGNEMTGWIEADDFTLAAPALITDVRFWSIEGTPGYNGSITWTIYTNNVNKPGTSVATGNTTAVTRTLTGNTVIFFVEVQDDFSIGAVALLAGTYWLGLHNGPLTNDTHQNFYWETTNANGTFHAKADVAPFTGSWLDSEGGVTHHDFAFQLYGPAAVPEPATLFLLGSGLAGLAAWRRRNAT